MATKSDVAAKMAFAEELRRRGHTNVRIVKKPSDVVSEDRGVKKYWEVKFTERGTNGDTRGYFGAATLTEWEAAIRNEEHYRFVVASNSGGEWRFVEYTPEEFMKFSTIPPFKVYFMVPRTDEKTHSRRSKRDGTVALTRENLEHMIRIFGEMRE